MTALKGALSGPLETLMLGLMRSTAQYDASELKASMKVSGTQYTSTKIHDYTRAGGQEYIGTRGQKYTSTKVQKGKGEGIHRAGGHKKRRAEVHKHGAEVQERRMEGVQKYWREGVQEDRSCYGFILCSLNYFRVDTIYLTRGGHHTLSQTRKFQ